VALVISDKGVRRLYAVDEKAAALGLYTGQKAADAAALVPELAIVDADPEGDAEALAALADWCVRFSPAVAPDARDGLFLDVTGVTHLWGGEEATAGDLLARLAANGIRPGPPSPIPPAPPGRWPGSPVCRSPPRASRARCWSRYRRRLLGWTTPPPLSCPGWD